MERMLPHLRMPMASVWTTLLFVCFSLVAMAQRPFITTWEVTEADKKITIYTNSSVSGYNYTVSWGDDLTDANVTDNIEHNYTNPGTYTVTITGNFPALYRPGAKLKAIEQWGDVEWESMEEAFVNTVGLEINDANAPNVANVTNMVGMLRGSTGFDADLSGWNVSNVTTMADMFNGASEFSANIGGWRPTSLNNMAGMFINAADFNEDLSGWDVSNVTAMMDIFNGASDFSVNIGSWRPTSVTDMSRMFVNAKGFNEDLSGWDVSKVETMVDMFGNASDFSVNISDWEPTSVTDMSRMFANTADFQEDLSDWDVSNVTKMEDMFNNTTGLRVNISDWEPTSVTDMRRMFANTADFNEDLSDWDVSNVAMMEGMFSGSKAFNGSLAGWKPGTALPEGCNLQGMFVNAEAFDQDLGSWDVSSVTNMREMLDYSGISQTNLDATLIGWAAQAGLQHGVTLGIAGLTYSSAGAAARDKLVNDYEWVIIGGTLDDSEEDPGITPGDPGNFVTIWEYGDIGYGGQEIVIPTHPDKTYNYAISWEFVEGYGTSGTEANVKGDFTIPTGATSTGGTIRVEIAGEFPGIFLQKFRDETPDIIELASRLRSIEQWGDIEWETMEGAFTGAYNLQLNATDIPDLSKVKSLAEMFDRASAFTGNSSMGNWNVENVEDMEGMFVGTQFDQPIGTWDVSNVTDMQSMFTATPFNQDISKWDVSKVTSMYNMFALNYDFNQNIGEWEVGQVTNMGDMFRNATAFNQDLSRWDVSNVTSMLWMFYNATSFDQDLGDWTIGNVADMEDMLNGSGMSTANYDATLIGWAEQEVIPQEITLGAEGITYCASAAAQATLETEHNWTFDDGGQAADCDGTVPVNPNNNGVVFVDINVDTDAVDYTGDGSSWTNALPCLSDALKAADTNPDIREIHVAEGTYYPTGEQSGTDREETFAIMRGGLALYGGYPHGGGTRDVEGNPTTLSGDIGIADDMSDNSYHVMVLVGKGDDTDPDTDGMTVDGFTITGGNANGEGTFMDLPPLDELPGPSGISVANGHGGGMLAVNLTRSTTIEQVTFRGNEALGGAGMANYNSSPSLLRCRFEDNRMVTNEESNVFLSCGGGMLNIYASAPMVRQTTFTGNSSPLGGAMANMMLSSPTIFNSTFTGNRSNSVSALVDMLGSGSLVANSVFTDHEIIASEEVMEGIQPATIANLQGGNSQLINSTVANNHGATAGAEHAALRVMANLGGGGSEDAPTVTVTNTIIYGNDGDEGVSTEGGGTATVTYSLVQGMEADDELHLLDGDTDPLFMDAEGGDYHLRPSSPAVDKGLDSAVPSGIEVDRDGGVRKVGTAVDLGAYEAQASAMEITIEPWWGEDFTLDVEGSDSFQQVKQKIQDIKGVDPDIQMLRHEGRLLEDGRTLADFEIESRDVLQLTHVPTPNGHTIYVDIEVDKDVVDYTGAGDSWENAVPELADVLQWARLQHDAGNPDWNEINPLRIFVAEGTYKPLYNVADDDYTADGGRENSFVMVPNVQLYGGFDPQEGVETLDDDRILPDRAPLGSEELVGTVLSGDLLGNDGDDFANNSENAYHVLVASGDLGGARLDGFTVTGGNANRYELFGPSVLGYSVWRNMGGGIFDCSDLTIAHCHITRNTTSRYGGGIYHHDLGPLTLWNSRVTDNQSGDWGGGVYSSGGSLSMVNVEVSGNSAANAGGGIYNFRGDALLTNVTVFDNASSDVSGVHMRENTTLYNSVILDPITTDNLEEGTGEGTLSVITVNNSLLKYAIPSENIGDGSGDYTVDPELDAAVVFTDPASGDYTLIENSPAIDMGDNAFYTAAAGDLEADLDLAGNPRVYNQADGGIIDLGAYEYQGERTFISQLAVPAAVTVDYGTAWNAIEGLPTTVTATLSDDTEVSIPLDATFANWTLVTPTGGSYDGEVAGSYVYNVPLTIPTDATYLNPDNLQAQVTVTVAKGTPILAVSWDGAVVDATEGLALTYGDSGTLSGTTTDPDGTVTFAFGDGQPAVLGLADPGAVAAQQAGTATLTVSQAATDNYEAASVSLEVTVAKKAVTIVPAAGQGKVYGVVEPDSYGYTLAEDESLAFDDELTDIVSASAREAGDNVGTYDMTLTLEGTQAANYDVTFEADNDAFVITPLEITVTADNQTKVFGTDDPALMYTYTPELIGTDEFTGALTRAGGENVGSYAITQGNLSLSDNYTMAFTTGTLTITSANYAGIALNDATFTYDGSEHSLSLAGDLPAGASVTYTIDSAAGNGATDAGVYDVTALIDGGDNYEDAELTATLTIAPLEITVTADNQSKVFGTDDPALTYTYTPELIGTDGFTGALTRAAGENVGSYAITQGNLSLGDNYTLVFEANTLNITTPHEPEPEEPEEPVDPTPITGITLQNASFTYDGKVQSLAIAGTLPEGASVTYGNNSRTDVGTQEVTATISGENYETLVLTAELTVAPAERTLSFPALPAKIYGDAGFAAGATASSGEAMNYTSSNPDVAEVDTDGTVTITGTGETTITATVPENSNYSSRPSVSQTLTVAKAPQTITFAEVGELRRDAGSVPMDVSASSGLPVELAIDDEEVATLSGTSLNVLRLGTVHITATQAGDDNHEPAEPVTVTVRVTDPTADLPVRVHQAVSPNGDGINEYLIIEAIKDYPDNRVTIFNRNGTVVWEASGYNNGTVAFRGIGTGQYNVSAGTYFYVAEIRVGNEWKYEKGWFVLRY